MMKRSCLILTLSLLMSLLSLRAQSPEGLSYQNVVACEGKNSKTLFMNLKAALYELYDSLTIQVIDSQQIHVASSFYINNVLIGKLGSPAGKLTFSMILDIKENKYRYYIYNFYFTPVERDRYGRFNLTNAKPVLVQKEEDSMRNKALHIKIKKQSKNYVGRLDKTLREYVISSEQKKLDW